MGKPSPPPAPDYAAAAAQQGQANIDAAKTQGKINNPNVINPYGTQTVTWGQGTDQAAYDRALQQYQSGLESFYQAGGKRQTGVDEQGQPIYENLTKPIAPNLGDYVLGDPSQPTITQKFSPEQQALYDQSVKTQKLLGGLGEQGATALQGVVGKPVDYSGLPAQPGSAETTRDKAIQAYMSRVNEDTGIRRDNLNSDLVAAGIRPGSKAYDDQMRLVDRAYNDAQNQAFLVSGQEMTRDFQTDTQRRKDAIAEYLSQRQTPLNEVAALLSGSQVQNPFAVPGYAQNANVAPAPTFAAANALANYNTDVYNAEAMQNAQLMQGLFGLGSSGLLAYGMA